MDRKQQRQPKPPGDGGDLIDNDKDQDDQDHNEGSGSRCRRGRCGGRGVGKSGGFRGSAGRRGPTDDELVAIEVHWPERCQPYDGKFLNQDLFDLQYRLSVSN
ncbi:hypothetical protein BYT27DRAFT_7188393 [Phlegmacium glaucopus]|nr:hypothetical protein BYT27DRAFT_7188393 [Phlegmacium glaucopus]